MRELQPIITEGESLLREIREIQEVLMDESAENEVTESLDQLFETLGRVREELQEASKLSEDEIHKTVHKMQRELHANCGRTCMTSFVSDVERTSEHSQALLRDQLEGLRNTLSHSVGDAE